MLNKDFILEKLNEHCEFNRYLCEETFFDMVVSPLEVASCFQKNTWTWDTGVTKGVLIFDELDYVIKIPFGCEYLEEEAYYDDNDNWVVEVEGGPNDYMFSGVQVEGFIHNNEWDYCETEFLRYQVAQKNAIEDCFAQIWFLGVVQAWPIYAQIKACMFRSESSRSARSQKNYSNAERETAKTIQNTAKFYVEEEWLIDFLNYWGQEKLLDFIKFCQDWEIDDLHPGNLGYVCGVPCVVDYSSFNG